MKRPSGTFLAGDTAASTGNEKGQSCWSFSPSNRWTARWSDSIWHMMSGPLVGAADGHAESMNRQELNQCPFNFRYMLSQALVPVTISQDVD